MCAERCARLPSQARFALSTIAWPRAQTLVLEGKAATEHCGSEHGCTPRACTPCTNLALASAPPHSKRTSRRRDFQQSEASASFDQNFVLLFCFSQLGERELIDEIVKVENDALCS